LRWRHPCPTSVRSRSGPSWLSRWPAASSSAAGRRAAPPVEPSPERVPYRVAADARQARRARRALRLLRPLEQPSAIGMIRRDDPVLTSSTTSLTTPRSMVHAPPEQSTSYHFRSRQSDIPSPKLTCTMSRVRSVGRSHRAASGTAPTRGPKTITVCDAYNVYYIT